MFAIISAPLGVAMSPLADAVRPGNAKKTASSRPATLELPEWVGQRFMLLAMPQKSQGYGYQSFEPNLPYAQWVGKILTVTAVDSGSPRTVTFKAEDGTPLTATAYSDKINYIAPMRDLTYARDTWLGRFLWLRGPDLLTFDAATEKFGSIHVGKGARIKVTGVAAGMLDYEPVHLELVADDGRRGFLDIQLTGTNVSTALRGTDTFDDVFAETDPHSSH
ncbi:MAG TPA: hypothetical protein VNN25_26900 [Thermoanaerobaculia bacterium]|nr:hypothetical protein [Thermoanaerobaculia bacterium]